MRGQRLFKFGILVGLCGVILFGASHSPIEALQTGLPINYGDTVNGSITNASNGYGVIYSFDAQAGDVISVTISRTSGNLRPYTAVVDPTKNSDSNDFLLTETKLSSDGKTAAFSDYTMPRSGSFALIVSRENLSKGTTTGKFKLTFYGSSGSAPTATPAKRPTTTPRITPTNGSTSNPNVHSFTVGTSPTYSVWSGNALYVANNGDGTVSILDDSGNVTGTIQTGGSPFAMSWDGARLWVADFGTDKNPGNSVTLYDPSGKKMNTYKVGKQPFSLSYDADDNETWIALYGDDKVVAVDPRGKIVKTVDVSSDGHNPNTVLWANSQLWVTLGGSDTAPGHTVISIGADGTITGPFTVGQSPADLAWDDTDQFLFVANFLDNSVTALDAMGNVVGTYPVGNGPLALAWDGNHLWITLGSDNTVVAMDATGKIAAKIQLDNSPNGIVYDGQSNVWVAIQGTTDKPGNTIVQINIQAAGGSGSV
jgi:YVTN family beta-propeller protein